MKRSSEAQLANKGIIALFSEHHLFDEMRDVRHLIARRAYQLFADRGSTDGHDLDDWLRAERELLHSAPVELRETDSEFILRAELPGFRLRRPPGVTMLGPRPRVGLSTLSACRSAEMSRYVARKQIGR